MKIIEYTRPLSFLIPLLLFPLTWNGAQAQATIGTTAEPERAALLDIRTQQAINPSDANGDGNVTSDKGGLLLPRVKLKGLSTLEPFIAMTDPEWTSAATTKVKELHTGLMVYNLTDNQSFKPGICIWDGARWQYAASLFTTAVDGLSLAGGDTVILGGYLSKPVDIEISNDTFRINGTGQASFSAPSVVSSQLTYKSGKEGNGKILMSDSAGNATWEDNITSQPLTPVGTFIESGVSGRISEYAGKWVNTGAHIELPQGRWMVMASILVNVNANASDRAWIESTFIKEGESQFNPTYFIGSTSISGALGDRYNILTGHLVIENKSALPSRFYYCIGQAKAFAGASDFKLDRVGSSSWGENSIVAFALVE